MWHRRIEYACNSTENSASINNNMFVLPNKVEVDSIAGMLSDDNTKVTYDDIAGKGK